MTLSKRASLELCEADPEIGEKPELPEPEGWSPALKPGETQAFALARLIAFMA